MPLALQGPNHFSLTLREAGHIGASELTGLRHPRLLWQARPTSSAKVTFSAQTREKYEGGIASRAKEGWEEGKQQQ